jgi:hypothetical protein
MTILTYIFSFEGIFDENTYSLENTHVYISIVRGVSVTFAFTSLFYLYLATKHHIHDLGPTGKFISIKFVVFLGFWQGIVIWIVGLYSLLPSDFTELLLSWSHRPASEEDAEIAFGNLLLCLEMYITAVMHHFVFGYQQYLPLAPPTKEAEAAAGNLSSNMLHAFSVVDVAGDATTSAKERLTKKKQ